MRLAIHAVAANGYLQVVEFLCAQVGFKHFTRGMLVDAAKNGHQSVVKWMCQNASNQNLIYQDGKQHSKTITAMEAAASAGHLTIAKYLHALDKFYSSRKRRRGEVIPRVRPICTNGAAANGHLEVVKWLHEHRLEGCSGRAMDGAASAGHLNVMQLLFKHCFEGCSIAAILCSGCIAIQALGVRQERWAML